MTERIDESNDVIFRRKSVVVYDKNVHITTKKTS